jgi:hypothetical protein
MASQAFAGPYDVSPEAPSSAEEGSSNRLLYPSNNVVVVTWSGDIPHVSIPASRYNGTDFLEAEILPLGVFDGTAWRFTISDPWIKSPEWSELVVIPESRAIYAVIEAGPARSMYMLVRAMPNYYGRPAYDLRKEPQYLRECFGACAEGSP